LARNPQTAPAKLQLAEFAPFRLNRLAAAVSEHLSEIYRERFGLEIPEWRVLVTVGEHPDCTAQQVASSARLHKTRVSRAVAALTRRRLLERARARRMPARFRCASARPAIGFTHSWFRSRSSANAHCSPA
jgi:hypothetical protein